jgi:integrase
MRGHVRKRGEKWAVVVELDRDPISGRRRQKWHSGYATRREAELACLQQGAYVAPQKLSYAEFLTERWLPTRKSQLAPSTFESYSGNARVHIIPGLGSAPLQGLSADLLTRFYAERLGSGLSARTTRYLHSIIHKSLADALAWGLVVRNVADAASPPSNKAAKAPPPTTWSAEQLAAFLQSVRGTRLEPLWTLFASTGLRRSEGLSIRWSDVDLDGGQLAIPVSKSGHGRSVALDGGTLAVLRALRKRQAAEKLAWGPAYAEGGYLFTREDGGRYSPDYITRAFREAVERLDVPRIRLHDLRHSWASLALAAGVNPKIVSERLGHATVAFTLDTYSHVMPGLQEDAAERVAFAIGLQSARRPPGDR